MSSLGEDLPKEMARVRDEVLPVYISVGPPGALASAFMRRDLDRAAKAMADGDLVGMMRVYLDLKKYEL